MTQRDTSEGIRVIKFPPTPYKNDAPGGNRAGGFHIKDAARNWEVPSDSAGRRPAWR